MEFTYESYQNLLRLLKEHSYQVAQYDDWKQYTKCVILRHDIDNDISKAVKLAAIEENLGIKSTYFVLVTSNFYNVFSKQCSDGLREILRCGHEIGLHFDEMCYPEFAGDLNKISVKIKEEASVLSLAIGCLVKVVSMHRPSKLILQSNLQIPELVNSYGEEYFRTFKYLSDSRHRWREDIKKIICSEEYSRLHILTHPFWYDKTDKDIKESVFEFVNTANWQRYQEYNDNLTALKELMSEDRVMGIRSI